RDDQGFAIDLKLEAGRQYRFRYFLDGHRWENDWAADAYVPNEFGGDDSLIDLKQLNGHRNVAASTKTSPATTLAHPAAKLATSRTSTEDISSGRRGGLPSRRGSGGRSRDQLYNGAREKGIEGRSKMNKLELERAVGR